VQGAGRLTAPCRIRPKVGLLLLHLLGDALACRGDPPNGRGEDHQGHHDEAEAAPRADPVVEQGHGDQQTENLVRHEQEGEDRGPEEAHGDGARIGATGLRQHEDKHVDQRLRVARQEEDRRAQLAADEQGAPGDDAGGGLHPQEHVPRVQVHVLVDAVLGVACERVSEEVPDHEQHARRQGPLGGGEGLLVLVEVPHEEADQDGDEDPLAVVQGAVRAVLQGAPAQHHREHLGRLQQCLRGVAQEGQRLVLAVRGHDVRGRGDDGEVHSRRPDRKALHLEHA